MSSGGTRLLAIEVEHFKSYRERRRLNLAPLTVLIGRNNSGKSALIQPLLLLKQALAIARPELVLNLAGELINARNVRDLTHGWPGPGTAVPGPAFAIEWETPVDIEATQKRWVNSRLDTVAERAELPWIERLGTQMLAVRMDLQLQDLEGTAAIRELTFELLRPEPRAKATFHRAPNGGFSMRWNNHLVVD